jgi:hypothetical protein
MKQLTVVTAVFFAALGLSSCTNKSLQFNNKVVQIQKGLEIKATAFATKSAGVKDGDLSGLVPDAKDLIADVEKKQAELNALETPKGGEDFKNSITAQFGFMTKIYQDIIKLADKTTTDEEKLRISEGMLKSEEEAQRLEDNTQKAQRAFASANGFKLESK